MPLYAKFSLSPFLLIWAFAVASPCAEAFEVWTWRKPVPPATFNDIFFANGKFVAVADNGFTATSSNGSEWIGRSSPTNRALNGVTHAVGKYWAVGDGGTILSSVDGETWDLRNTDSTATLNGICYEQNKFVVVGNRSGSEFISTSTDGITWIEQQTDNSRELNSVTFEAGRFVAVGESGTVRYSSNGFEWFSAAISTSSWDFHDITHNGTIFVAVGDRGATASSVDGIDWVLGEISISTDLSRVAFGNGKFVTGGRGEFYSSADGITWDVSDVETYNHFRAYAFGSGIFVGAGSEELFTSTDAISWTEHTADRDDRYYATFRNGEFVVGGERIVVQTSPDGVTWTNDPNTDLNRMDRWAFGNNIYVAASGEEIHTSPDGENWTGQGTSAHSVVFDGSKFLAIDRVGIVKTSTNGITWTTVATGLPHGLSALIHGENQFVAAFYDELFTSGDGIAWTKRYESPGGLRSIAYGHGLFVAVGTDSTHSTSILTSPDGIAWTERAPPSADYSLEGVVFGDGYFVAAGDGAIFTSVDGVQWISQNSGAGTFNGDFRDVAFGNGLFVVVGHDGSILTAPATTGGPFLFITSPDTSRAVEGTFWSHAVEVESNDNGPIAFAAAGLPEGTAINPDTGVLSGNPVTPGRFVISVSASNVSGAVSQSLVLNVLGDLAWKVTSPGPLRFPVREMIHQGSRFIGVGDEGSVATSSDGFVWNAIDTDIRTRLNGLVYGGGTYVAVGEGGTIGVSTDLFSWQWTNPGTSRHFNSVTYGNSKFVAVGDGGIVFESPNGIGWTEAESLGTESISDIDFVQGRFIAVVDSRVYRSPDAVNWESTFVSSHPLLEIAYGNGVYAIVGSPFNVYISTDGIEWTGKQYSGNDPTHIIHDGNQFVAAGNSGVVYTSSDGEAWTRRETPLPTTNFESLAFGAGTYVAIGDDSRFITSTDGVNWGNQSDSLGADLTDIAFAHGLYVAVGTGGRILTSSDGETWTPRSLGYGVAIPDIHHFDSVVFGGGQFLAIADQVLYSSTDGLTWTYSGTRPYPYTDTGKGLIFSDGQYVSVGNEGDIRTSADGASWTSQVSGTTNNLNAVVFSNGTYVAVGSAGAILTSADGSIWTVRDSPSVRELFGITYGDGQFIAVGLNGVVLRSADAINWVIEPVSVQSTLRSVTHGQDGFLATGDGVVFTSVDGTDWKVYDLGNPNPSNKVIGNAGRFIGVGDHESILSSSNSNLKPTVGFQESITATRGLELTIAPEVANSPTHFAVSDLPPGMVLDPATGILTGIPTAPGNYLVTLTAANDHGSSDSRVNIFISDWITRSSGVIADLTDVAFGNGIYVAVGASGTILVSPDGVSWNEQVSGTSSWIYEVIYSDSQFIAVGSGGVLTSPDGVNWVNRFSGGSLSGITKGNGIYVAVGSLGRVITSPDTISWTVRDPGLTHTMYGVSYGDGKFIAVASSGRALASTDGVTWSNFATTTGSAVRSIAYVESEFIAVGSNFQTSPDGISWTQETVDYGREEIRYLDDVVYTVGGNSVYYTNDGETWTASAGITPSTLYGITVGDGQVVAVGNDGTILASQALWEALHRPASRIEVEETGVPLTEGGDPLDFGLIALGSPTEKTITIRNSGTENFAGIAVRINGGNAAEFDLTPPGMLSLAPGEATTFSLSLTPIEGGLRETILQIESDDTEGDRFEIAVQGFGAAPEISVENQIGTDLVTGTGSISFGDQMNGESVSRTFTILNKGGTSLSELVVTSSGDDADQFSTSAPLKMELDALESTTFTVSFNPDSDGNKNANIHIASNDSDENPFDIAVSGMGTSPEIVIERNGVDLTDGGSTIEFFDQVAGETGTITLTVRNTGTAPLADLDASISGPQAPEFSAGDFGSITVAPGASTTFDVSLTPVAGRPGVKSASLEITSNDSDENPFVLELGSDVIQWSSLQSWGAAFGLSGDSLAPTSDEDNDGMTIVEEYAFDLDPSLHDSAVPSPIGIHENRLQANFLIRRSDPNLTYTVEFGEDLTSLGPSIEPENVTDVGLHLKRVIIDDSETTATSDRRFGRLIINYDP